MVVLKNTDPAELDNHFQANSSNIRAGPVDNEYRSCNDICCLITFILMMLATLVIGAIMINDGKEFYNILSITDVKNEGVAYFTETFSKYYGIIIGMFVLSFVMSIVFLLLVKKFTKCMVYTLIVLFYLAVIALIVIGAINGYWWMVIVFGITLLITTCMLCCFKERIRVGILLMQVASQFISEKPSVYVAPLYPFFWGLLFFVYWLVALLAVTYTIYSKQTIADNLNTDADQNNNTEADLTKEIVFLSLWVVVFIFMAEFLYYVLTYLVASACANWYYGLDENYYTKSIFRLNRYHLGSLTFGALIVTVVNILKRLVQDAAGDQAADGNAIIACCLCLVGCCLSCIEDMLQTLNHNAVIVMSVTGESYINSAKTALSIIFENFGIFYIVDFFSDLLVFFGVVLCVGIPTLIGFLVIRYQYNTDDTPTPEANYAAIMIFFLSILVSCVIIGMLGEALSCVFIFYCFDRKFARMGIRVPNCPEAIRNFHGESNQIGSGQELQNRY